jgi:hypothetical protein
MALLNFFFFDLPKPSSRTTAVVLARPLTEISTKKFFWRVKLGRRVTQTSEPSVG